MDTRLQPNAPDQLDEATLEMVRKKTARKVNQAVIARLQKSIEATRSEDAIGRTFWVFAVIVAAGVLGASIAGLLLGTLH